MYRRVGRIPRGASDSPSQRSASYRPRIAKCPAILNRKAFIQPEVERYFPSVDTILVSPRKEVTNELLRTKLGGDSEPDAMDDRLRADIMEIIQSTVTPLGTLGSLLASASTTT